LFLFLFARCLFGYKNDRSALAQASLSFPLTLKAILPVPTITGITQSASNYPTDGGVLITIAGSTFGLSSETTVTVGGQTCANPTVTGPYSQITCVLPAGFGSDNAVYVKSFNFISNRHNLTYNIPGATFALAFAPLNGPTAGGMNLTISGSDFGTNAASGLVPSRSVMIGDQLCAISYVASSSLMYCTLPPGRSAAAPVQITIAGRVVCVNTALCILNFARLL
jgi:hypothetical protein